MRLSLSVAVALIGFALLAVAPASARGGGGGHGGMSGGVNSSSMMAVMRERQAKATMAADTRIRQTKAKNLSVAAR